MTPRKTWNVAFVAVTIVFILCVSGCASIAPDERPEITLADLRFTEATLFETTMVATVRISNPSLEPIVIEGATFKLVLDDKKVGRGMMNEPVTVDGLDSTTGNVVFRVNNASALLRLRDVMESEAIGYGIVGSLYLQRGSGTTKVKVDQVGRLNLRDFDLDEEKEFTVPEALQ